MHTLVYKRDLKTQQATSWCPTPPPPRPSAPSEMGGVLILKSSNHWGKFFCSSYGGEEGGAVSGNQRRGHGIIQVKTIIII